MLLKKVGKYILSFLKYLSDKSKRKNDILEEKMYFQRLMFKNNSYNDLDEY